MYIDLDIEGEIADAVAEHFANGGDGVTYEEYDALQKRVETLEREIKEQNFWKADRNHSHKDLLDRMDKIEKDLRLIRAGFPF